MKARYLDESGEHNPMASSLDYPIFVLGGIIADKDYSDGPLTDALSDFKRQTAWNYRRRVAYRRHRPQPERV